jgi:hypothetical protein
MYSILCCKNGVYVLITCSTFFCLCVSLVDPTNLTTYVSIHVNLIYHLLLDLPIGGFLHDETHTTLSVRDVSLFISCVRGFYFCRRLFACFSLRKDTLSKSDFVRLDDGIFGIFSGRAEKISK